jgi:hypothetical protein
VYTHIYISMLLNKPNTKHKRSQNPSWFYAVVNL